MRRLVPLLPALLALGCAEAALQALPVPLPAAAPLYPDGETEAPNAPYQLDANVQVGAGQIAVDLGSSDPAAEAESFGVMTIVGASGASPATLERFTESCVELCGAGTAPVCHYAGIYAVAQPDRLGAPIAALPRRVEVSAPRAAQASDPVPASPGRWSGADFQPAPEVLGDQWVVLDDFGYRWSAGGDGRVRLESNGGGEPPASSPELALCNQSEVGDLTQLRCDGAAFLYEGERLLVASFGANVPAAADVRLRFRADGGDYALVEVGLRTRRAVGLLFRDGPIWRIVLRPPDYPAVC